MCSLRVTDNATRCDDVTLEKGHYVAVLSWFVARQGSNPNGVAIFDGVTKSVKIFNFS